MEPDVIFDEYTQPRLRILSNGRVVDLNGTSVGFVKDDEIFNYAGGHIGWYENGYVRDTNGYVTGYGRSTAPGQDLPRLPIDLPTSPEPPRLSNGFRIPMPVRYAPGIKPPRSFTVRDDAHSIDCAVDKILTDVRNSICGGPTRITIKIQDAGIAREVIDHLEHNPNIERIRVRGDKAYVGEATGRSELQRYKQLWGVGE